MAKANATLGHVRIELVEGRDFLLRPTFRWRTRYVKGNQIGVWSEAYRDRRDAERSIRAHRNYLGTCAVSFVRTDGTIARLDQWAE